ncbi:MarR family transcriptional regulator [Actibacterium mucosum KCTC 23349]|uniref:MarR family transcriptional regulator n=1 Tax=Actibacterium mucosum KCTC 23349 TaxID=1454373 RepID=A0A037ZIQ9_9RHOB|nr:MarR family transcriptional regulator [Actibacterium mucosum]KAJ55988.1 MarR family transcriptional regulator [Actibacterium mucosum KCTC 23349]
MPEIHPDPFVALFFEAGIINQIGTTFLEKRLSDGLLASHFGVVNHLMRVRDGATPLELARAFQVPKTTMTHTLAGLEKHGFVQMRPNPDDKRSKQVWLTDAGRAFRDETLAAVGPIFAEIARRFDRKDAEDILPTLTAFRQMIDQLRDEMD